MNVVHCFGKKNLDFLFPDIVPRDSCTLFILPSAFNRFSVRDFALSPNKDELFFTVEGNKNTFSSIIRMTKNKGKWDMALAPFCGNHSDIEPSFSADGNSLYFVSNRPITKDGDLKDYDIWRVKKINGIWSFPENMGEPVNTSANEFYPAIATNGNIYYTASYKNSKGKEDIYESKLVNGKYTTAESLSDSVNSLLYEFNAFVAPDESYIIFTSFGRTDDMGGGDLYISKKDNNGNWMKAKNLGEKINSPFLDYCPSVSLDKKFFVFTSDRTNTQKSYTKKLTVDTFLKEIGQLQNGKGNLYWIDADEVLK